MCYIGEFLQRLTSAATSTTDFNSGIVPCSTHSMGQDRVKISKQQGVVGTKTPRINHHGL